MNLTIQPTHIKSALILIVISLLVGFIKFALDYDFITSLAPIQTMVVIMVITALVMLFFAYKIWTGRNWARIVFTIFFVIGIYPAFLLLPAEANRSVLVFLGSILQVLLQVAAIIFMYLPTSNNWFKSVKSAKNA